MVKTMVAQMCSPRRASRGRIEAPRSVVGKRSRVQFSPASEPGPHRSEDRPGDEVVVGVIVLPGERAGAALKRLLRPRHVFVENVVLPGERAGAALKLQV